MSSLQVNAERSGLRGVVALRRGWSTASTRTDCRAAARPRRSPRSPRDDLQAFHRQLFRAEQHGPGDRRRRDQRGGVCGRRARVRRVAARRGSAVDGRSTPPQPTRRIVVVDKPDAVQTEIRVGQLAIPRKHTDYMAWDLTVKDPRRRGRQPAAPGAAIRARPDLRCQADTVAAQAGRRLRGRNRHAHRDDRRDAAADGGGVLAPAAPARVGA